MDELDTYIHQAAETGKPYSVIYQELVNVGWSPAKVASRINNITEVNERPSVNKISPMALLAITMVVIALIVFVLVSIWANSQS